MSKRIVDDASLIKVADAIRNKCGTTDRLVFPDGFESAIASIDTAGEGIVPTGTIYITENNKTFDVTTYAEAEVNIQFEEADEVKLQTKAVTPNAEGWVLEPESGYTGFSKVTVTGDSDLVPENIKKDVNIFGVTGTYEGTADSGSSGVEGDITVGDLSELHAWEKYSIGDSIIKTDKTDVFLGTAQHNNGITVEYANKVDTSSGSLALSTDGYGTVKVTSDSSGAVLNGKVIRVPASNGYLYYEIPTTATVDFQSGTLYDNLYTSEAKQITYTGTDGELVAIVVSEDSTAYPQNGEQNGYKYVYKGTLDEVGGSGCNHETVTQATPSITVSSSGLITATSIQDAGLVSAGTKSATKQLTTMGVKTYTPGTSSTFIPANTYLTGQVTIDGDADLVAGNIKKGVTIFNVEGTYESTGGRTLVTKTGTTTTASFNTGLSEIVAITLDTGIETSGGDKPIGLYHAAYVVTSGKVIHAGCSSSGSFSSTFRSQCSDATDISGYFTVNGGTFSWSTATGDAAYNFINGQTYNWSAVGYE